MVFVPPSTLVDLLCRRAAERPDGLAYVFLADGETEAERLTYGELDRRARAVAAWLQGRLQGRGAAGERVLLLFSPGLEFITAFFGCLYAGAVAVPTYPPRPGRAQPRLRAIAGDARPRFALAGSAIAAIGARAPVWAGEIPAMAGVEWQAAAEISDELAAAWREPALGPETLAFLQYTSGSTADPKGVMVSHGNLLHNEEVIRTACGHTAESTFVSWLPMYHDMGLIGSVLQPLYLGAPCVLLSPAAFLQRPVRWLQAISRYRAHTSGAPDFAYGLCVRKVPPEERERLDLSGWKVAFNGAEPVRAETLAEFATAFAPSGFRSEAFFPCYGLAEATLIVSGLRRPEPPRVEAFNGRPLVSCGPAGLGQTVAIVDSESLRERAAEEVGEIWVSGPSVAQGYWGKPEESALTFRARLAGKGMEQEFLRTGDLGFLRGGELFVTGRLKDLIIIRGRNHYPQDVERTAERSHPALRPGGVAAFAVLPAETGGEERLVVVQELERRVRDVDVEEVAAAIRRAVAAEHEVEVYEVVLVRSDAVPKTSSGKVQRRACGERYLAGELPVVGRHTAATLDLGGGEAPDRAALLAAGPEERRALVEAWLGRQTGGAGGGDGRPLAGLGLDSLRILELQQRIETDLGASLALADLFAAPSLGALAERVVESWDEEPARRGLVAPNLEAAGETVGDRPLSHGQKALWFVDRLAPESAVHNLAAAAIWRGVEADRLAAALRALTGRHPALRTTIPVRDGEPVQRVHESLDPEIIREDASGWDADRLLSRIEEEVYRPFDLEQGPLLRAAVFTLAAGEQAVVLAAHHIIADLRSLAVVLRELGVLCAAGSAGVSALPPLPLRPADVVRWQERRLAGAEGERLWAYWRERLAGDLPLLDLPTDRPRPAAQRYRGTAAVADWGTGDGRGGLGTLARAHGATLAMTLLAGFLAFLQRYTGQEDLLVGTPAAGRGAAPELADLVGYFVQPVVVRADVSADPPFAELLAQVRRTAAEAIAHQDFPLDLLAERLHVARDTGRSPLFQAMFAFQSAPFAGAEGIPAFALGLGGVRLGAGDLEIESLPVAERRAPFEMTLMAAVIDGRLAASLALDRDLFDAATAGRMLAHLGTLLAAGAADPALPVSALPLLSAAEREQAVHGWNATRAEVPEPALVHELFAAQAARTPEAVAVELAEEESWTYRELSDRCNQLARCLATLGVGPETPVGIFLDRSPRMVAGLLAVLQAGGCYVPLDPAYPRERLELMLHDCGAPLVLTERRLADLLPATGARHVCLDVPGDLNGFAWGGAAGRCDPDNLAYVIYTSGSTGRPKGVQVRHRSLVNLLHHMRKELDAGPSGVLLSVTTLSFDIAGMDVFLPLISGARLVLVRRETAADGRRLARQIERSGATLMQATPATWHLLLEAGWTPAGDGPRLTALCGGEAMPPELARQLRPRTARLWNAYGPTETTIWSAAHEVERTARTESSTVPIGGPVANTELYVLDRRLEPVPVRVAGDLYIGGLGLARGYLRRPDLTAAAFVPDPWSGAPGARLYRTGDVARRLPEGEIEFLGRSDTQVKVRGFRIELGEIEAVLESHPEVARAVVVVWEHRREDRPGDRRLAAYVVPRTGSAPEVGELRAHLHAHLQKSLPEHMVPAVLVLLAELPLTASGKIDRRALPAPGDAHGGPRTAPQGPLEEALAAIWAEALGVEEIGADESFFALGGHSLLAARMLARVEERLGVELPMRAVFERPTVARMAAALAAGEYAGDVPRIGAGPEPVGETGGLHPLSYGQRALWLVDRLAPESAVHNLAAAAIWRGVEPGRLAAALRELAGRHPALRTTVVIQDGEPVQHVHERLDPGLVLEDASAWSPDRLRDRIDDEVYRPFDLERGPLVRIAIFTLGPGEQSVVLAAHHIIADLWSFAVVLRELGTLCAAGAAGVSALPPLPLRPSDVVRWQERRLAGEEGERLWDFWRRRLGGDLPLLDLPTDRPRSARPVQRYRGTAALADWSRDASDLAPALRALGQAQEATLAMTLLAGFLAFLHRTTGQADLPVGTPSAGRGHPDLAGLVGYFVNPVVVRGDLAGDPSFAELLARVRRTAAEAYEHQDFPLALLAERLHAARDGSPLFQAMFSFQSAPFAEAEALPVFGFGVGGVHLRAGEIEIESLPVTERRAPFDLTLTTALVDGRLMASLTLDRDLFDETTATRMLSHLRTLLAAAAVDPALPVSALPLLSAAEREQTIHGWNATREEIPEPPLVHELFAAQARRTPEAVAVEGGGESWTYRELSERCGRLARRLTALGVGLETPAALVLDRSPHMVAALLAVLRAGGAYVPLDPALPRERLALMLGDCGAPLVLTERRLADLLPEGVRRVCLDAQEEESGTADPAAVHPDNLAYIIYTSGSTGRPKGVQIRHRSLVNLLAHMGRALGTGPSDVLLSVTTFSFDIAGLEIFLPLITGARLVLAGRETAADGDRLAREIGRSGATLMQATPATWHLLVGAGWEGSPRLTALCGGEALPPELARQLLARTSRLLNVYGPTETTIWSASYEVTEGTGGTVPIGGPVANTQLHVLDRRLEPVPPRVAGDLYIGGVGLARGYLDRPDLTAEAFVPDPWSGEAGARLYRTGDLTRRLPDGEIEFLGRGDAQVKLRGFRIELGEIEAVLESHPDVSRAAAAIWENPREDRPGDRRLVAYAVPRAGCAPAAGALREHLQRLLPEHSVPAALVLLEALPLTPNGKVDRRALPAPEGRREEAGGGPRRAPRGPLEEALAAIFGEVLGIPEIGADDSFFALGGHSLLVTQVVTRAGARLGMELPLRAVFEQPTVARLAAALAAIPPMPLRGISPTTPREDRLPLSFAQQRLWFLDRLEAGRAVYKVAQGVRLRGPLAMAALRGALDEIVRRHETLRTTFAQDEDGPVQVVGPAQPQAVPVVDLDGLPREAREAEAGCLATEHARRPFDLARGPLLRITLVRLAPEEHLALFSMHHIASDGWSMGVFLREVAALYSAVLRGESSPLPELPVQYADYALWHRRRLESGALDGELAYWRGRLAGHPPLLLLPTDRPRPAVQSFRGSRVPVALPAELSAVLDDLGRRERSTLFMVLLTAFQVLLHRITGQEDILVGSPIAGRRRLELEGLIGFFANTLVLRLDLAGDPTWRALLAQAREATLAAYDHQDLPFERLVEALQPERTLSFHPLFQVLFVLQNAPAAALALEGLDLELVPVDTGTAKLDLALDLTATPAGLDGWLEYDADLFDRTTAVRLAGHFERLLEAVAGEGWVAGTGRIAELPLLRAEERAQILTEWSTAAADLPAGFPLSLAELFERQAAAGPERPAVVHGAGVLSYGALDRRADVLAHRLRSLGVGPDVPVGIFLDRTPLMTVAVLAVLKAGGGYLPLDPAYPPERLAFMLADSAVPVLLTQERLAGALATGAVRVLSLDGEPEPADQPAGPPERPADLRGHLGYVIYTSGSTGRPKAVEMPQGPLLNLMDWQIRRSERALRTLQFAPLSFDPLFQEMFSTWGAGGALYLATEEMRRDPAALLAALAEWKIERLLLPFVALRQLAEAGQELGTVPPALGEIVTAGEALQITPALVGWLARLPLRRLDNHYGPSETHAVTFWELAGDPAGWPALPPIGRPLPNVRLAVLDARGQAVPVGVPGELLLGGVALARGYRGRPEVTAERFVPDPFHGSGERLYRTGDLVRWRTDGALEFLGRIDHQVKVRGYRVELGEIEAALMEHSGVRQALVVALDGAEGKVLLACVVPDSPETAPSIAALRAGLRARLPEPMVPARFAFVGRLPLTPSGKVDRKALEWLPPAVETDGGGAPAVPLTPVEELVAGIFADLLQAAAVRPEDSFFELGGHSLLAMRLVSRLRSVLGIELPVRAVFEAPTVRGLAAVAARALREGEGAPLPPLVQMSPEQRTGPLPLSFAQQRLWFLDQLSPGSAVYILPAALRLEGTLDAAALDAALTEIVRRHEALRTTFERGGDGEPVQRIAPARAVAVPVVDLRGLRDLKGPEARRLAAAEARRPFDLERGPLLRCARVVLGEGENELLVALHHIVSDGWSIGVLVRELTALYGAFAARRPSPLPELPVQYADYAQWQRSWLAGPVLAAELAHWRERLAGAPPALDLPVDRPRPPVRTFPGEALDFALPGDLLADLRGIARRHGTTLFMVLMAAFQALLARWSGQSDVSVGSPVAGRTRLETEDLIGFFVNTLVLRTRLGGEPGFGELLARARQTTLAAYAHQDVPFESLVEELQPERDLARTPLFQVMLALQNVPASRLELSGLRLETLPLDTGTAKFELSLALAETGGVLQGTAELNRDLFDATTVRRLLGHFEALLRAALTDPEASVFALPLLGEGERQALLVEHNDAVGEGAGEAPLLPDLFAEQVRQRPAALAVVSGEERLTYGELDWRADRLARRLRALGVGPEARAGVLLERSPDLVIALLAVLKAGGAYVPLDPAYPAERLRFMMTDAGLSAVVTRGALAARIGAAPCPVLDVERAGGPGEGPTARASSAQGNALGWEGGSWMSAGNLAYVIYTSGSTGSPKGVAVSHGALSRLIAWFCGTCGVRPRTRVSQIAGLGFDATVEELWPALASGAELHLAPGEVRTEPARLRDWLLAHEIEVSFAPTPLAEALLALEWPRVAPLRLVLTGGDRLRSRPRPELPFVLINGYGPTEATVVTTSGPVGAGRTDRAPGIGHPLPYVDIYLLDSAGRPVPIGVTGELCIGGAALARGYLGDPARTAERFVPDPLAALKDRPGGRLYRTGDLARWPAVGGLDFLGRLDAQVKVRGVRIEPAEIEAALLACDGVREAVVVAPEESPGDRRLIACVVPAPGAALDPGYPARLRERLRDRLPEALVPSAFVVLDSLPLTAHGKVDRRALERLAPVAVSGSAEREAPRTPAEELLSGIFAEVLGVEPPGAAGDFFALGGHSLLAGRVVSRVREVFAVELPLRALFEAPTVAALAAAVESAARAGEGGRLPPIERAPRDEPPPLSFAQQRLWFLDQMVPGSPAYNIPAALRMAGDLAVPALGAAFAEIVRRHEILRTTYPPEARSGPVQRIAPAAPISLPLVDLAALPEPERSRAALRLAEDEAQRPFNLAADPPLRLALVRQGAREHLLVGVLHHIAGDGWSIGVLARELTALYEVFSDGLPSPLAELPVQYADFAVWQRRRFAGGVLEAELAHWRERLRGAPLVLELPADRPRTAATAGGGLRGAVFSFAFPAELVDGLRELSRRAGVTLFMALLTVFQELLARSSGQDDFLVGSPVAGRGHLHLEPLIGFFFNVLTLRAQLDSGADFSGRAAAVRAAALDGYAHQEMPFDELVRDLQPGRDLTRAPLVQVLFALQNLALAPPRLRGLEIEPIVLYSGEAKVDMTFNLEEAGGGLSGGVEYARDLFDAGTVERLVGHWRNLLEAVVAAPAKPLAELPLLGEEEQQHLLAGWQGPVLADPGEVLFHHLIEAQAARTPGAVAVVGEGRSLTYGELDAGAARLAARLRRLGVGPDVPVAICAERSPELIVGLLAILKAGGAYVPLDPAYPRERLALMKEDALGSQTRPVLLVDAAGAALFPGERIPLGAAWDEGSEAARPSMHPDNLAYLIYTSGSTGRPKGVMISHRAIVNHLLWMLRAFPLSADDAVLFNTSFSFDISILEIFLPLCAGARVVVARPGGEKDPAYLAERIAARGVTVLNTVPSLLNVLLDEPRFVQHGRLGDLGRVFCGGEALSADLRDRFLARLGAELTNFYGPTEATVYCNTWLCMPGEEGSVPIGRPMANVSLRVLDRHGNLAPPGAPGELLIAGVALARGYHGAPALTAERFIPDPWSAAPGGRLYRTGDLARSRPDGTLEFLGRLDHQVKIRGFRIEPGEVEAVLRRHPAVREALVVARTDRPGEVRLVAYAAGAVSGEDLKEFLRTRLPEHMVPSFVVLLPALPLLPNGKVDRRALPAPEIPQGQAFAAPRTPLEEDLAGLWSRVLGVPQVGRSENFFDLGGHSLLMIELRRAVQERFGRELSMVDMFQYATVAAMAEHLGGEAGEVPAAAGGALGEAMRQGRDRLRQRARRQAR
jgi:amino acid adenylation domain-containing protein